MLCLMEKTILINQWKTIQESMITFKKIATGQRDDYSTGCLRDYPYFKKYDSDRLSKKQVQDADPKAIQKINFNGNLDRPRKNTMFFIIEEAKETILAFSQGTVRVL